MLLLHGALGVRGQFDSMRKHFQERSQIAMDFPSHGDSTLTGESIHCERLAQHVLALLDALQVDQVDIIGHSMGGYVGLVLAHQAAGRVRSVVNLGTKFYWSDEAIAQTLQGLAANTLRGGPARHTEALSALHAANGLDNTLRLTQSLIADFRRWQLSAEMVRASAVPVLLCCGDRDKLVPALEVLTLFGALDPKLAAMALLPNTPHPLQHLPLDCFEQIVRRFWASACRPVTA